MKKNGRNGTKGKNGSAQPRLTTTPLPASRKVYVTGTQPGVRVPFREISLTIPAQNGHGSGGQAVVMVYDTSGPYTDPQVKIDIRQGLPPLRLDWIGARADSEQLPDISSEYGRLRAADASLVGLRFAHLRRPRRALPGGNVSQLHYARQGLITPEMEYIALRENQARELAQENGQKNDNSRLAQQHPGNSWGAS